MTSRMPKRHRELEALIALSCDGLLSASQRQRLNELLADNPEAIAFYVSYLKLEGIVSWDFGQCETSVTLEAKAAGAAHEPNMPVTRAEKFAAALSFWGISRPTPVSLLTAALVVALLVTTLALIAPPYFRGRVVGEKEKHTAARKIIARLTNSVDAVWAEGQVGTTDMAYLMTGHVMDLKQGVVQVDFNSGARVLLQGPTKFELLSEMAGYLHSGKLTARIAPAARGFRVDTPVAPVVDLGTEFGVNIERLNMEVEVFAGKVIVEKSSRLPQQKVLLAGESLRLLDSVATIEKRNSKSGANFVSVNHFEIPQRWLAHGEALLADRDLVAYYNFEQHSKQPFRLVNLGSAGDALDGLIYGTHWSRGRWTNKGALAFGGCGSGDYVDLGANSTSLLNFDGPLTIAVWFRSNAIRSPYPAIVTKGDTSWRMHLGEKKGDLGFGTSPANPPDLFSATKVVDGRWHLGVAVWIPQGDRFSKLVYVDGKLDAISELVEPLARNEFPVFIGENSQQRGREFHGQIDELAIFSRALTSVEIENYYKAGSPYELSNSKTSK